MTKKTIIPPEPSLDSDNNSIDKYIGSRIRLRRAMLGFTQEKLAEKLGITFQQVQKYEKGLNRVGASRLWELSQVLDVEIEYFYADLEELAHPKETKKTEPVEEMELGESAPDNQSYGMDVLMRRDIIELLRYYDSIKDRKVCKSVLELVRSISRSTKTPSKKL